MTRTEFNDHWIRDFAPLTSEPKPNYDEFKINERMLEDYLDIFRGYNTRKGEKLMPYPHPFFDSNGKPLLEKKPSIKFILIGEARLYPNKPSWNSCKPISGDIKNTYVYDIRHVANTPYLNSLKDAWICPKYQPCPTNKIETLLCLASKGVLLLDLFPFALEAFKPKDKKSKFPNKLKATDFRKELNKKNITRNYWDSPFNPYSIFNRLVRIESLICEDWDLTLVAPCTISEFIVNPINRFPPITLVPVGLHPCQFRTTFHDKKRCKKAWDWRKVAVSSAGGPTMNLIRHSF
jgi:hypothetical protein